jgi:hypothetical protein
MATVEELEKEAEKKSQTPKPDPFEQDARRQIKKYKKETASQRQQRQKKNREESPDIRNNGHPFEFKPWFETESQKGLSWRAQAQKTARNFFAQGYTYEWILWKMKRDMGIVSSTAKKIIDDALDEEPEKTEPSKSPFKKR